MPKFMATKNTISHKKIWDRPIAGSASRRSFQRIACSAMLGLGLSLAWATVAPAPAQRTDRQAQSYREMMEEKVAAELARRSQVLNWARSQNPSQDEIFRRLNQPLLEGNRTDYERNMRLAEQFRERAEEARRNRQEQALEQHMETARAFRELAECNRMIFEGVMEGDKEKLESAYSRIPELEAVILAHTRRRPPRDWLTPDELRRFRRRRTTTQ